MNTTEIIQELCKASDVTTNPAVFIVLLLGFLISEALPFIERFFGFQCQFSGILQGIVTLFQKLLASQTTVVAAPPSTKPNSTP